MEILTLFRWFNNTFLAIPTTILFLGAAVILTIRLRFIQFRAFKRFASMVFFGMARKVVKGTKKDKNETISGFHALFAAMATAIGTGSIVAPSLAVIAGGPGALFWLLVYQFFGAAVKFSEVVFAIHTREITEHNKLLGGPMQYLKTISPFLSRWYGSIMLLLFLGWETVQSNTLANIWAQESVPEWIIGLSLAIIVFAMMQGGAQRVGAVASKLVPLMFCLYVFFSLYILSYDTLLLKNAFLSIFTHAFTPQAIAGGFVAALLKTMKAGIYRGIFISEAGLGTSSIPHALADTKKAKDQGILAMYSTLADMTLSIISGLLVLVTGVWLYGNFRATLIYEAFKLYVPGAGQIVLLASVTLFVLTTVIGNGFNGMQTFATFTRYRWMHIYTGILVLTVFFGALMPVPLVWEIMDTLLACAAVPNMIGLLLLSFTKEELLQY